MVPLAARPPLDEGTLRRELVRPGELWHEVRVVTETGSTNADLLAAARDGAPEGTVLAAELQTTGRGRLDRGWASASRAGLMFSVLLRPPVPVACWAWVPLLTGMAVAGAVRRQAAVPAQVKWPNDVLSGDRKLAGVLAEREGEAIVVGVGLNVTLRWEELPTATATSLALEGAPVIDRARLLAAVLRELAGCYSGWVEAGGDPAASGLHAAYKQACVTVGRAVRVRLPGGGELSGGATGIDSAGRLLVRTGTEVSAVSAGDVVHVR